MHRRHRISIAAALTGLTVLATIAATAIAGPVADAAGGSITSVAPTVEQAGNVALLKGKGFTNVTAVSFAGSNASFTVLSSTQIKAVVPPGATTGKVSVVAGSSTLTSRTAVKVKPTLTGFAPTSGVVGATVTLTGTGFTAPATVSFNGGSAPGNVVSPTQITATVPAAGSTGPVKLTTAGSTLTGGTFTYTVGISLSATVGPPTSVITVSGSGFTPSDAIDIYAGTTDIALATADSAGNFTDPNVTIPASAQPGALTLTAVGRSGGHATQTTYTVATNWPQLGGGASRLGSNSYENTLNTSNVNSLSHAPTWSYATGGQIASSPAFVSGNLYVGSADHSIYDLNATTGAKVWSYATGNAVFGTPAVANGIVYDGSEDGSVYALNATTGAKIWSHATGTLLLKSPAVLNGVVYMTTYAGSVFALNASTGAQLWTTTVSNVGSAPAVANGVVYVGSSSNGIYALNASTGAVIWNNSSTDDNVNSALTVFNGIVYFGSGYYDDDLGEYVGGVYALNASNGAQVWEYNPAAEVEGSPTVSNGVLYIGTDGGDLLALNALTGAELWDHTGFTSFISAPAVANGVVYAAGANQVVQALDASTGNSLWSTLPLGVSTQGPIVVNGVVYSWGQATVSAFTLVSGSNPNIAQHINPATLHPNLALKPTRS